MNKKNDLPLTEELDFAYLLGLLPPLTGEDEFEWLPELFSVIGYERLLILCKYAGGEIIKIPTIEELTASIEGLQWFYDVYISKKKHIRDIPEDTKPLVMKIKKVYDAR